MRISVLREREAFGEIVAATLRRFWNQQYQRQHAVVWAPEEIATHHGVQTWLCNDYLNCVFVPRTGSTAFGPIRDEFGTSVHRWRTPLQKLYVELATHPISSSWFAHRRLLVSPPIPTQSEQLIVPGNTKIRLLSANQHSTWVALKEGFDIAPFLKEIEYRHQASAAGVPVPAIEEVDADGAWLREQYVRGTPTNRLPSGQQQSHVAQRGFEAIRPLVETTLQSVSPSHYSDELAAQFRSRLPQLHCVSVDVKQRLDRAASELLARSGGTSSALLCSQTHGDFQPGNVLLAGNDVWIIDWEYAGRRLAIYDPLVIGLASRFSTGLADRLRDFVLQGPQTQTGHWPDTWPAAFGEDREERALLAIFFLFEELILHVRENAKPPITKAGRGLHEMLRQVERYLKLTTPP